MIEELRQEIRNAIAVSGESRLAAREKIFLRYLIFLKYLCETDPKKYDYQEVIEYDQLYEIIPEIIGTNYVHLHNKKIPMNRILVKMKKMNIRRLLLEYLDLFEKPVYFHNDNEKVVIILNGFKDICTYYNIKGNTTYLMSKREIPLFQAFDQILGIENHYITSENDIQDFDYVYFFDAAIKSLLDYSLKRLSSYLSKNHNVIYVNRYRIISNIMRKYSHNANYLNTVLLRDEDSYLIFNKDEIKDEIVIINYNPDKIKDDTQLKKIIENSRKQKDLLVKITLDELRENNYRIGFNLYQLERTNPIIDLNKKLDENRVYLNRLTDINDYIDSKMNVMFNK